MWTHVPNTLRAAFGSCPSLVGANFNAQSLFNNSSGAHLLRVWMINELNNNTVGLFLTKTRLTTQGVGTITPAVTDQQAPPGVFDQQTLAALTPGLMFTTISFATPLFVGNDYPFCVLRPGWSLVVTVVTAASPIRAAFYWDYVFTEELLTLSAGDSVNKE